MHNLKSILFSVIFLLVSGSLFGQCSGTPPLSVTVTSILESRCESNGEITINPSGGTPFTDPSGNPIYDNAIIAGPVLAPIQSSSTFSSLEAGTYMIEVTDANGCTTTISAIVPGTHVTLGLTFEATDVTCLIGGSVCGIPADGRPWPAGNYEYELFDDSNPPVSISPRQIDSCFMNLVAATYKIRVYDSCNNFQTRDFIIGTKNYSTSLSIGIGSYLVNCDTACIVPSPSNFGGGDPWGEFPYNWQIVQSGVPGLAGSGVWNSYSDRDTLCYSPISPSGNYGIRVSDACGNVITNYYNTTTIPSISADSDYTCGAGGEIDITSVPGYICDAGTVTYEVISVPAGAPVPPTQTTPDFSGLEPGTYCFRVTDCCGYIQTICEGISAAGWSASFINKITTCEVGEIGFAINTTGNYTPAPSNNRYWVISAPPGYPHPTPINLFTLATGGVTVLNYVTGPPGTYCWSVRDDCGIRDTMCNTFTDTLEFERDLWVVPGCVSAHQIKTSYTSNTPTHINLDRIMPNPATIATSSFDTCFNNLPAGTYRVRYRNRGSLFCSMSEDTIVIPEYIPPAISGVWGIQCINGEGIISTQGSGGILPYTFELFQGPVTRPLQASGDFYGLPVGQYDVRIVDSCLNSSITTVSIEPFAPVIKGYGGSFCVGEPANIYVDSISVATYSWTGPNNFMSTNANIDWSAITFADAGTYTVEIDVLQEDQSACVTQTVSVNILVDCSCSIAVDSLIDVTCNGFNNGIATALSEGIGPYTYVWSTGATTQSISNLAPGTFAVTITDSNGCVSSSDITIAEPTALTLTSEINGISCFGNTDGSINACESSGFGPTGGTMPYAFIWSTGDTTCYLDSIPAGTYYLTVTDGNGCIATIENIIIEPAPINIVLSSTIESCPGKNATANGCATTGGTAPYDFFWSNTQTTCLATGIRSGVHIFEVTDANGCHALDSITVAAEEAICSSVENFLFGDSIILATFSSPEENNPALTKIYYLVSSADLVIAINTDADFTNDVENFNCYRVYPLVYITAEPPVPLPAVGDLYSDLGTVEQSCHSNIALNCNFVCFCVGPACDLTYDLEYAGFECSGDTLTDIFITNVTGDSCGQTTPVYTFNWSTGATTQNITGVSSGTYIVTVTDCSNCFTVDSIVIGPPLVSEVTGFVTSNASCVGDDGGINVTLVLGDTCRTLSSILWSNGATTEDLTGLTPGTYTITVTTTISNSCAVGPDDCFFIESFSILDECVCALTGSASVVNEPTCNGDSDGIATASVAGGDSPYSYLWSDGQQTVNATGLGAGNYNVTVLDINGCSTDFFVTLTAPAPIVVNITSVNATCFEGSDGSATATAGSSTVYQYTWSDGQQTSTATGLTTGTYSVTMTDAAGCFGTASTVISEPAEITVTTTTTDVSCGATNDGTAIAVPSNGNIPYTYQWDANASSQTTSTATGLSAGIYTITITDANSCSKIASVVVSGTQPCNLCEAAYNGVFDICTVIAADPNHPVATLDCDNGGIDNQTECNNGNNPYNPIDDTPCDLEPCKIAEVNNIDICALLANNPTDPLGTLDCDNGGIDNATECNNGGNPKDPSDDCQIAEDAEMDICAVILANPASPLATLDCDNGGVDNQTECANGENPFDPTDDCQAAIDGNVNICQLINYDPNHPLASLDCDQGGIDNYTECQSGQDPSDPVDDCETVIDQNIDICLLIINNPNHPLASLDCDNGGVSNTLECQHGTDPNDPSDDCVAVILCNINVCNLIGGDPNHPLADQDCDGGGMSNIAECAAGSDPNDPADDCIAAIADSANICAIIGNDPNHPMATTDCDNGGVPNLIECLNGEDPSDSNDCQAIMDINGDICSILLLYPNSTLGTQDCDNGGVDNQTECDNNGDPFDPVDDCQVVIDTGEDICAVINSDPNHPMATIDCDNGGIDNYSECINGGNPSEPSDDCMIAKAGGLDICAIINYDPNHPLAALDCDNGGIDNYTECVSGSGDPLDPMDDCQSAVIAGLDLCVIIDGDPNHPWATMDCDNGGIPNLQECIDGTDPSVPIDDKSCPLTICEQAIADSLDICAVILADPNHELATLDCDNGGITNADECTAGGDPLEASDDCMMAISKGLDLCLIIDGDPNHPMAGLDCDGGGVSNIDECNSGENPAVSSDDCQSAIDNNLNICQIINFDPTHQMASLDCDGGGIDNWTECSSGGDPSEPSDDCSIVITEQIDICVLLTDDPNNPIGNSDCDDDGVTNATECAENTDPLDPCDFMQGSITLPVTADQSDCPNLCPDLTPVTTILPGNIAGVSGVCVSVRVSELNGIDTDGSAIVVRMPSDPRFIFAFDSTATSCGLLSYNNPDWKYLGDNGFVHNFEYVGPSQTIPGSNSSTFGFAATYDPQSTDGQTTITATIRPFSGGECNVLNNTDSERLVYFE